MVHSLFKMLPLLATRSLARCCAAASLKKRWRLTLALRAEWTIAED
jgi:hypothetical protein